MGSSSTALDASCIALPYSSNLVWARARFARYTAFSLFSSIACVYKSIAWEYLWADKPIFHESENLQGKTKPSRYYNLTNGLILIEVTIGNETDFRIYQFDVPNGQYVQTVFKSFAEP